ncbi:MAG: DUF5671 domain-containing protein [Candidatus Paceibacterota bacterium]
METQINQANVVRPKLNVGFFFLSLGVLISLITSVVSFLNLVFETLNKRFPDVLNSNYQYGYSTYEYESIRSALATLIIFFPVFLLVSYFWKKFSDREMGRLDEIIRKWVIYIILFLSSLVVIIDLVMLVRYFISGEITSRFVLKAGVALVVAILIATYYIFLVRGKVFSKIGMVFSGVGVVLVVSAISYSFMIMGSPAKQRMLRLDDRRVGDLQNIQYQVINFWQQKEKLPTDLKELSNPISGYSLPVPPEFEKGEKYEYTVLGPLKFELCATFAASMPKGWREYSSGERPAPYMEYPAKDVSVSYPYSGPGGGMNESWDHQAGRTCYERTIDKDIFPPYPKPSPLR